MQIWSLLWAGSEGRKLELGGVISNVISRIHILKFSTDLLLLPGLEDPLICF